MTTMPAIGLAIEVPSKVLAKVLLDSKAYPAAGFKWYYYGFLVNALQWIALMSTRNFQMCMVSWCIMRVFYSAWTLVEQAERGWIVDDDAIGQLDVADVLASGGRRREGLIMAMASLSGSIGTVCALSLVVLATSMVDVKLGWYGQTDATRDFLTF